MRTPKKPWPFSRAQWFRLLAYFGLLREQTEEQREQGRCGPPSILEVYLSYVDADGGRGFDDGTDGMQRTLPTQLATFTLAMRSAEVILGLPLAP